MHHNDDSSDRASYCPWPWSKLSGMVDTAVGTVRLSPWGYDMIARQQGVEPVLMDLALERIFGRLWICQPSPFLSCLDEKNPVGRVLSRR